MKSMVNSTQDLARETARTDGGQFGFQEHSAPELTLDSETADGAYRRGVSDARNARPANPGALIDDYMDGYESELADLADDWETQ